jgi:osmoprotectant transport system permease protein
MDQIRQILQFIADPQDQFAQQTWTTIQICAISIAISIVIGVPIGILVARRPVLAFIATNLSGLVRALPTFAVLIVMLLVLKRIGLLPSVIALTALGIPPILLNTVAGLQGVDPAAVDAGRGMGMTRLQLLWRVEIPLVLPVVAAGVRNAAVQIVATVPLASLIGADGYGDYVFLGLSDEVHATALLVGGVSIALLALLTEGCFALLQRSVTPKGLRVAEGSEPVATAQDPLSSSNQPVAA